MIVIDPMDVLDAYIFRSLRRMFQHTSSTARNPQLT